jgi:hypothetical protein
VRTIRPLRDACLLLVSTILLAGPARAADTASARITAAEAAQHLNQEATVCGLVAGAKYADSARGKPTFLDFEKPYPGELFRVVIWGSDRERFPEPPERTYGHQRVCVSGKIKLYRQTPEIVVRDRGQLAIQPPE